MKIRIVAGFVLGVLCVTVNQTWSDQQSRTWAVAGLEQRLSVEELLSCRSFVPDTEESYVHIGGGFFAYFNRRDGIVKEISTLPDADSGAIKLSLRELGYESRLIYLPEGSVHLETPDGRILNFKMEVLDYVQVPGNELPCYRLIAHSEREDYSKAILLCHAVGTESPYLVGMLYLVSGNHGSSCSYEIEIGGRNDLEAENHLWKVVAVASRF
jgi:hypothetical protein